MIPLKHKYLTLSDLNKFCEQNNFTKFNAIEFGQPIFVQVPTKFDQVDNSDPYLLKAPVLLMHTSRNLNGSTLPDDAALKAMQNLAYKPVLANFCEIDDVRDFTSHDFDIDDKGNYIYYEKQVGCLTAEGIYMEQDTESDDPNKKNVFAQVAIPRDYTDAADIIERKNGTYVSVELAVNSLSYDAKAKELVLLDVDVTGLTLLGTNPETGKQVNPGMENAHIQLTDFTKENNSLTFNLSDQMLNDITQAVIQRLGDNIAEFSAQNLKEGGEPEKLMKFNELLEKYNKTAEDITFDYEGMTDEELENAFKEAFEDEGDDGTGDSGEGDPASETETDPEPTGTDPEPTGDEDPDSDDEDDDDEDDTTAVSNDDDATVKKKKNYSKLFEISHEDIRSGLYALLTPFEEADNEWYWISQVFDDHFTYEGWDGNNIYDQKYSKDGDEIKFEGDRVHMNRILVTDNELVALNEMKANYAAVSEKLSKYESEPDKMSILNSADYANIAETEAFAELKKQENHFDLSVDEVKAKADSMLLEFAKGNAITFAAQDQKPKLVGMKRLPDMKGKKKSKRYGNLFDK